MRLLWVVVFMFSQFSIAQQLGYVYDEKGEAIAGATIYNKTQKKGQLSQKDGSFQLEGSDSDAVWIVSFVGFQPKRITTASLNDQASPLKIYLSPDDDLEEVVVTGTLDAVRKTDSPIPVSRYAQTFFKANPSPSVFEAMQLINGIRPQLNCNVCNTGDIHINGQEGANTMVLIDGLPIVSGLATVYGLAGIPQALIEQVELIKGPAATLYGSEAIGGVINLITKMPESAPQWSIESYTSSWGEVNTDLGARYTLGKNKGLLGVNYFNFSQPIDQNKDNFTDLTLQHRLSIFNKITGPKNSVGFRVYYEDRWGGEMNWTPKYRGGSERYGESIYTSRWELFGRYDINQNWFVQYSLNSHSQNAVYGPTAYLADQHIGFLQTVHLHSTAKQKTLWGLSYRFTDYDDNTPATVQRARTHLPGVFIQKEWFPKPNHTFLTGLRWDYNTLHGNILTPRINYKWNNSADTSVFRLGGGTGYRVVNVFTEDHAALTGAREVIFEEKLKPEQSWNITANWVQKRYTKNGNRFTLDGSFFYTHFSNRILPDYDSNPNQIRYANLDSYAINRGIALNTNGILTNGLQFRLGMTWIDAQFNENGKALRPILTETFTGNYSVSYRLPTLPLQWDWTGTLIGPMRLPVLGSLDPRPAMSPTIHDSNIQLRWQVNTLTFFGGVKNIFNFTPPDNSIARAFDPFDRNVTFDNEGAILTTPSNPFALSFDPSYVYYSNQGRRFFLGMRYQIL
ncbi:MAG: TonB-dependent receptor [Flavobacteriaceae bacterium]